MKQKRPYGFRRRLSAWILGIVLAVSLVPRDLYHDLFADHIDGVGCTDGVKGKPCAHAVVYNCHFDYSGSFTPLDFEHGSFEALAPHIRPQQYFAFYSSFIVEVPLTQAGRGPPFLVV